MIRRLGAFVRLLPVFELVLPIVAAGLLVAVS